MGTGAIRARPAMREIAYYLMGVERKIFEAQGRRGGGSWKQDTEAWLIRKVNLGLDPRINIATHALMRSMSEPEAPGQVLHVGDRNVRLGSALPYAEVTEENRPFTRLLPSDRMRMRQIVERYLLARFYA
jgi:hypothetical protein